MNKTTAFAAAVLLAILLTACGQKPDEPSTAAQSQAASPVPSASPSQTPEQSKGAEQETVPPTKPADSAVPEETDPDAPAPLLPVGNLETDESGNVVNDPSETANDASQNGMTAEGYEGLNMFVTSNRWSSKDKATYVTIEVENGSEKSVEATSDLFVAITVDKSLVQNGVGSGFKSMKILPGGKAKFEMNYSIKPEEIAGFALLKGYDEDPLRVIITNPAFGGN